MEHFDVETNEKTIFMLPIDQADILKLLDNCPKSNVPEYDFISNQTLSFAAPLFAQPVTHITNECLPEVFFPKNSKRLKFYQLRTQVMLMQSKL